MYVQSKIWGKYATSTWGFSVIEVTAVIFSMAVCFLFDSLIGWPSVYWIMGFGLFLLMPVFSYYSDSRYDKKDDDEKLNDFNDRSNTVRYLYLAYVLGLFYVAPLTLILFIVIDKLEIL